MELTLNQIINTLSLNNSQNHVLFLKYDGPEKISIPQQLKFAQITVFNELLLSDIMEHSTFKQDVLDNKYTPFKLTSKSKNGESIIDNLENNPKKTNQQYFEKLAQLNHDLFEIAVTTEAEKRTNYQPFDLEHGQVFLDQLFTPDPNQVVDPEFKEAHYHLKDIPELVEANQNIQDLETYLIFIDVLTQQSKTLNDQISLEIF